ncbi:hypothetical protein TGMAS_211660 [Toxoplasma gondii MAS]|uniref:Uncharacterized protein n=1 Tax=Toxoplasma gondii MAS TaxID=943118 RepID=A0A086Q779_TOXGO|nr:hypothetical protein TGMAS_211660 [Toxoplasma gondii MAS]
MRPTGGRSRSASMRWSTLEATGGNSLFAFLSLFSGVCNLSCEVSVETEFVEAEMSPLNRDEDAFFGRGGKSNTFSMKGSRASNASPHSRKEGTGGGGKDSGRLGREGEERRGEAEAASVSPFSAEAKEYPQESASGSKQAFSSKACAPTVASAVAQAGGAESRRRSMWRQASSSRDRKLRRISSCKASWSFPSFEGLSFPFASTAASSESVVERSGFLRRAERGRICSRVSAESGEETAGLEGGPREAAVAILLSGDAHADDLDRERGEAKREEKGDPGQTKRTGEGRRSERDGEMKTKRDATATSTATQLLK